MAGARRVYTLGFTGLSAERFFETLREHGIRRLVDVRISNTSQLAGFTKRADLPYFLHVICDAEYRHEPLLAPTGELMRAYREGALSWAEYERFFLALLRERRVEQIVGPALFDQPAALLCTEPDPGRCRRRLALEHLTECWGPLEAIHLQPQKKRAVSRR